MTNSSLTLRNRLKKRKPNFVIKESGYAARVKERWRAPRGIHSAWRQNQKGRPKKVSTGYGSPRKVKGLHSSGLIKVMANNAQELAKINPAKEGAILSAALGNRKRLELIKLAQEKKIRILNFKDQNKKAENIQTAFQQRKKVQEDRLKTKSKKQEEKKNKSEEKKKKEEEEKKKVAEEEKGPKLESQVSEEKNEELKEEEKTLIKRQ